MKRSSRPVVTVLAMALVSGGLAVAGATPASAATGPVLGPVTVSPTTGNDSTGFTVSVANAACPAGTDDAFFDIKGADIGELGDGTTSGSGDLGYLGAGGGFTGPQSVPGNSIANLKTGNAGSFATSGAYKIRFRCQSGADVLATYESTMNYLAGGSGAYTIAATPTTRATATTLSASPAGPFAAGTPTDLTADVTPTTGADDATGSIEFFNGVTSLGIDNTLTATGGATLVGVVLPAGSNSLTAVYTPDTYVYTASTSPAVPVTVTAPVAPISTTSALTASPDSGPAYEAVTLTCDVTAASGSAAGTALFKDGAATVGSAPVTAGVATLVSSSFAPGAHSFTCAFTGTSPYVNSTSAATPATYGAAAGPAPDPQTVTVVIPQGALTITTPYTPEAPLALGTALLDASDSTYSASAPFADIVITDTRAGQIGWTANVVAGVFDNGTSTFGGDRAGLTALVANQVAGNALLAADVTLVNNAPGATTGLGVTRLFASYPAGKALGTANISGTFGIDGVPTSVTPGTYTSTVVFTAA